MTRGLWVDENNDVDPARCKPHEIDTAVFALRDPKCAERLAFAHSHGLAGGVYVAWNWYPATRSGPEVAEAVSARLAEVAPGAPPGNPRVLLDLETHDLKGYVLPLLKRWRELRPNRVTDWTFEGMQGGLFDLATVADVGRYSVKLAPAFYHGDMTPHVHSVILDLLMAGFQGYQLLGMYDAAVLPYRWKGYAFSQGRLP